MQGPPSAVPAVGVAVGVGVEPLRRALPVAASVPTRALLLVGLWAIPGLLTSSQIYLISQLRDRGLTFWGALLWQLPAWEVWALGTPVVLALGRRYRFQKGTRVRDLGVHVAANLAIAVAHLAVGWLFGRLAEVPYYRYHGTFLTYLPVHLLKSLHVQLVVYWGVLAVGYAVEYQRRYREGALVRAQLETRLAHAQLDALKAQLHPHFLFNTLHAIGVLVRKQDTQGSIRMLTGVSELLRIALESGNRQVVPLKQELDFVDRYLAIEQIRFSDRLRVSRAIAPDALDAEVPTLILQPLVENAIKHGIAPSAAGGELRLTAARQDGVLCIVVINDGGGDRAGWEAPGTGTGLANVRARLEQLYPGQHRFVLSTHEGGGVRATLELPYREAAHG